MFFVIACTQLRGSKIMKYGCPKLCKTVLPLHLDVFLFATNVLIFKLRQKVM